MSSRQYRTSLRNSENNSVQSRRVTIDTPSKSKSKPDLQKLSLRELIAGRTHTAVGDIQFDCPPLTFPPWAEFVGSIGNTVYFENPRQPFGLLNLINYTPNQMDRLRSCVASHKQQRQKQDNIQLAFTYGKMIKSDELQ